MNLTQTVYIEDVKRLKLRLVELSLKNIENDDVQIDIAKALYCTSRNISSVEERELCNWLEHCSAELDWLMELSHDPPAYREFLLETIDTLSALLPTKIQDGKNG